MKLPFLTRLENWALRLLIKSPRTGLVVIKQMDGPLVFIAADPMDDQPLDEHGEQVQHLERIWRQS